MEFVNIYSIKSIPRLLNDMAGKMVRIGTSLDAKETTRSIKQMCQDKGVIIILGNEENGISKEVKSLCDHLVLIPYAGFPDSKPVIDSLNVAQASSVIMYELMGK